MLNGNFLFFNNFYFLEVIQTNYLINNYYKTSMKIKLFNTLH